MNENREGLSFSVDSRVVEHFGTELVSKPAVALAELVKNAYDADASEVRVRFFRTSTGKTGIEVSDNGEGMTGDSIKRGWMRIATPYKEVEPVSRKYRRPRAGQKGIGRFAAHRLGRVLMLLTKSAGDNGVAIRFDWDRYKGGQELSALANRAKNVKIGGRRSSGTVLRIHGLRDRWTKNTLKSLRTQLVDVVSPPSALGVPEARGKRKDPGMRVVFEGFPGLEDGESSELNESFLSSSWIMLTGKMNQEGKLSLALQFPQIDDKATPTCAVNLRPDNVELPGPFSFTLFYFNYSREYLKGTGWGVSAARKVGEERGGVRVYRDGLRIVPYGAVGNDWLRLDERRGRRLTKPLFGNLLPDVEGLVRPMLDLPGNNQLFGTVNLTREENPGLRDLTNREGLVENDAFSLLRDSLILSIEWLTLELNREKHASHKRRRQPSLDVDSEIDALETKIEEAGISRVADRKKVNAQLQRVRKAWDREIQESADRLGVYRSVAAFGMSVMAVGHEISGQVASISEEIDGLKNDEFSSAMRQAGYARIQDAAESIRELFEYSKLFVDKGKRPRRKRFQLLESVRSVRHFYTRFAKKFGISVDVTVNPAQLVGPMLGAELRSVIGNLISNALKWSALSKKKRSVAIQSFSGPKFVTFVVEDSGPGVSADHLDTIFDPFVSYFPEVDFGTEFSVGIGLGLTIVNEISQAYGGSSRIVKNRAGRYCRFEIDLPRG